MSTNKILVVAVIVIVIVVAGVWFYLGGGFGGVSAPAAPAGGGTETRSDAPSDVVVPDVGATNVPANVAVPQNVAPAAPGVSAKFRSFEIKVDGGKFVPDTLAVNVGDTVNVKITAVDKDYDFVQPDYGFSFPLPKGIQKTLEFGATTEGKYTFYCSSCGGPDKGPVGYIIVVKK